MRRHETTLKAAGGTYGLAGYAFTSNAHTTEEPAEHLEVGNMSSKSPFQVRLI